MSIQHDGKQYEIVRGSDVVNDGLFLELWDNAELLLYAFWSEADGGFTFSAYRTELPFDVVEAFIKEARRRLPPKDEPLEPSQNAGH